MKSTAQQRFVVREDGCALDLQVTKEIISLAVSLLTIYIDGRIKMYKVERRVTELKAGDEVVYTHTYDTVCGEMKTVYTVHREVTKPERGDKILSYSPKASGHSPKGESILSPLERMRMASVELVDHKQAMEDIARFLGVPITSYLNTKQVRDRLYKAIVRHRSKGNGGIYRAVDEILDLMGVES